MPIPRAVARFNRVVTNPIQRLWAGRLPGFAIVEHTGRRSGTTHRTPVNAFRTSDGFAIALTYGAESDWVRNVLVAGGGHVEHRGRRIRVESPSVERGPTALGLLPPAARVAQRLLNVDEVLTLRVPGPAHVHFEPFLHLAGLTHDDVLIAWGGFYFRDPDGDGDDWAIIEDPDLGHHVDALAEDHARGSIGVRSKPYGHAVVEVFEVDTDEVVGRAETSQANHVWVRGLEPDTEYRYRVMVDGEPWAEGPRRDWMLDRGLGERDLEGTELTYDTRFRTFPAPDTPAPCRFAVLGDYGIGILASGGHGDRQRRLGAALERAVDHAGVRFVLSTGDNIYLGEDDTVAGTGDHDDDWYFSFYEPYRYTISRVPVFPGVGNHDTGDSEVSDNRDELADNMFTDIRFREGAETGRYSVDPGLYYQFDFGADLEFTAIDTTTASELDVQYFFQHPHHREFLENAFPPVDEQDPHPRWRIPFSHHPPFCAGPKHLNAPHLIEHIVPLLERAGVRLMLSGHEHNFQHLHHEGIDYLVTGAAGKLREGRPAEWQEANMVSWRDEGHFLIVDVDGDTLTVHPVTDVDEHGRFTYLEPVHEDGSLADVPIVIER